MDDEYFDIKIDEIHNVVLKLKNQQLSDTDKVLCLLDIWDDVEMLLKSHNKRYNYHE